MPDPQSGAKAQHSEPFVCLLRFLGGRSGDTSTSGPAELEELGQRYEALRAKLIHLFRWKGCPETDADVLADQTFDRLMHILGDDSRHLAEKFEGDPVQYLCRVGRNVFLEWTRRPAPPKTAPPAPSASDLAENEAAQQCLDLCVARLLSDPERELILDYYQGEKRRKIDHRAEIALRHSLSVNALRIQVCRIRERLRECVAQCVSRKRNLNAGHLGLETKASE